MQPETLTYRSIIREALKLGLDAVTESFDAAESKDDRLLAEARHRSISAALMLVETEGGDKQPCQEKLADLKVRADSNYCRYIDDMMKPECLGQEYKFKVGKFGKVELDAHVTAAIKLGRHQGLMEAIEALSVPPHVGDAP